MKNAHMAGLIVLCLSQVEFANRIISSTMAANATPPPLVDVPLLAHRVSVPIFRGERYRLFAS